MTLKCSSICLKNYGTDDLSRVENKCLTNCFHKHYRYHAYANALFTYLTADQEMGDKIHQVTKENYVDDDAEENDAEMLKKRAIEEQIRLGGGANMTAMGG